MGMYGFSNVDAIQAVFSSETVSIPDGDVWFFKLIGTTDELATATGFQSPMGMYGFSNLVKLRNPQFHGCFNPRWGCMVFQNFCVHHLVETDGHSFNPRWGCMVFQMRAQPLQRAVHHSVSIPDGDVWFFKSALAGGLAGFTGSFNPRWGCMVFQMRINHLLLTRFPGFNPRWGCMVFQMRINHLILTRFPGFNPRWGCMVFQIRNVGRRTRQQRRVSIPDGDVWFFKCARNGRIDARIRVSIPDGDVWFFKYTPPLLLDSTGYRFNPRWGCMVFQMASMLASTIMTLFSFQSPMGMYGFSN